MSKTQTNSAARLIREHYRASRKAMQKHVTHLYLLYQTFIELERQLGKDGFKQWMRINCPEIPWADVELVMQQVKDSPLAQAVASVVEGN